MKEQEYIDVRNLSAIMYAKRILVDALPNPSEVIDKGELQDVLAKLSKWETDLFNKIKIK